MEGAAIKPQDRFALALVMKASASLGLIAGLMIVVRPALVALDCVPPRLNAD